MKSWTKVMTCFVLGLAIQGGVYYYLDRVLFIPTADFAVTGDNQREKDGNGEFPEVGEGKKYYSYDEKYMAVVTKDRVDIYTSGKSEKQSIDLKGRSVSFFEWMPDRNLGIMGLFGGDSDKVVLAQFNPEDLSQEKDTSLGELPRDSRIVDAAYSTATNVVYMKVKVDTDAYRVYRTDANYDTRRVYMQASNIGRIAVFFDEDRFFYDNVKTGDVFMFNGTEGGWRVINPNGRYRLIGVDSTKDIYIANVNKEDKVLSISRGKLGVGFTKVYTYDEPVELSSVTLLSAKELSANSSGADDKSSNSSGSSKK